MQDAKCKSGLGSTFFIVHLSFRVPLFHQPVRASLAPWPLNDPHRRRRSVRDRVAGAAAEAGRATRRTAWRGRRRRWRGSSTRRASSCIQDMNFSRRTTGEEGLHLLARSRPLAPTLPVVLITAWGSIGLAVEGMKAGAADFITKPWTNPQILQTVRTALGLAAAAPATGDAGLPTPRGARRAVRLRYARRTRPAAAADAAADRARGADRCLGAGHGRERHGQGARGGGHPPQQPPGERTVREGEPRRHLGVAVRERDVRTRARAPSPTRAPTARAASRSRTAARSSSTRSATSMPRRRSKCCACCRTAPSRCSGRASAATVDVRVVSATNRNLAEMVDARRVPRGPALSHQSHYGATAAAAGAPGRHRAARQPVPAGGGRGLPPRWPAPQPPARCGGSRRSPGPETSASCGSRSSARCSSPSTTVLEADDFQASADMQPRDAARDTLPAVGSMTLDEIEKAMILKSLKHHAGNISKVAEALGLAARPCIVASRSTTSMCRLQAPGPGLRAVFAPRSRVGLGFSPAVVACGAGLQPCDVACGRASALQASHPARPGSAGPCRSASASPSISSPCTHCSQRRACISCARIGCGCSPWSWSSWRRSRLAWRSCGACSARSRSLAIARSSSTTATTRRAFATWDSRKSTT